MKETTTKQTRQRDNDTYTITHTLTPAAAGLQTALPKKLATASNSVHPIIRLESHGQSPNKKTKINTVINVMQ
jgi:hypothetical protein